MLGIWEKMEIWRDKSYVDKLDSAEEKGLLLTSQLNVKHNTKTLTSVNLQPLWAKRIEMFNDNNKQHVNFTVQINS